MVGRTGALAPQGDFAWVAEGRPAARNRKVRSAFTLAAAIVGLGLAVGASQGARAANIFQILFGGATQPVAQASAPAAQTPMLLLGDAALYAIEPLRRHKHRRKLEASLASSTRPAKAVVPVASAAPGGNVCVRLCDGFFFPVDAAASASACSSLCPDAPVSLYRRPAGSDKIEEAISEAGAPYSRLPTAFRHQSTLDNACTCHVDGGRNFSLSQDVTLRKGDAVMTAAGFEVFDGAAQLPHRQANFSALAKAKLPRDKFAMLSAMERAALPGLRPQRSAAWLVEVPARSASLERADQKIHFIEAPTIATQ